jgi:Protein of unknown function (DUF3499)
VRLRGARERRIRLSIERGIHQSIGDSPVGSAAVNRQCSRTGCAESAVATLTYQYARSVAWLDELSDVRDPHGYDLCERHAERLQVPHGWRLEERRRFYALASSSSQLLAG